MLGIEHGDRKWAVYLTTDELLSVRASLSNILNLMRRRGRKQADKDPATATVIRANLANILGQLDVHCLRAVREDNLRLAGGSHESS